MFITLIMVMVSWMYAHVQTHQIVYVEYVQFLRISYTSMKLLKEGKLLNRIALGDNILEVHLSVITSRLCVYEIK